MDQEVAKELEAFRDDPCYPVHSEKAVIKRIKGFDMPWVKCIPLEISVVWDIDEIGGYTNDQTKYTLEESYPGYLRIEYDTKKMDQINNFYICGPSPQKPSRVNASLRKLAATLHIYRESDHSLERIVTTNDPSGITAEKGIQWGGLYPSPYFPWTSIVISSNYPPGNHYTIIGSSRIFPNENLIKNGEWMMGDVFSPQNKVTGGELSIEEIQRGLQEEKLVKQFAIHEVIENPGASIPEWCRRDGTATLHINFAKLRERWQVMVNTINVIGYGTYDRNFGVQVHTERKVEIVIENGEFKSAEGKTSFVSIKPYSLPAGLYRCREENVEVAGSGTDVEAERYDQVRHAERFSPPQNPQDEALKQEWLKIEKFETPYAFPQTYSVKGTKSGTQVDLFFPKDSGYVVAHRCDPGDDFVKEWQQKWRKEWKANERWTLRDYDRFLFPETVKILLEDDWYTEYDYTTKYYGPNVGWKKCQEGTLEGQTENTDQIRVKRIE